MKYIAYILTMPNVGSWNGKWSGEGRYYARVRKYKNSDTRVEPGKSHYYNFGDGWGASIRVEEVSAADASSVKKNSKGFFGYEWMIDSIEKYGEIKIPDLNN